MPMDTERLDRLDIMIRENRVIRRAWTEGHERACLLATLSPEAGKAQSASACDLREIATAARRPHGRDQQQSLEGASRCLGNWDRYSKGSAAPWKLRQRLRGAATPQSSSQGHGHDMQCPARKVKP